MKKLLILALIGIAFNATAMDNNDPDATEAKKWVSTLSVFDITKLAKEHLQGMGKVTANRNKIDTGSPQEKQQDEMTTLYILADALKNFENTDLAIDAFVSIKNTKQTMAVVNKTLASSNIIIDSKLMLNACLDGALKTFITNASSKRATAMKNLSNHLLGLWADEIDKK